MHVKVLSSAVVFATLGLSACGSAPRPAVAVAAAPVVQLPTASPNFGPVLGVDGRCTGQAGGAATIIEPGIGECDLVRLKGRSPTDVLVGEGAGKREVQVLYAEPGGRELYLFVDNRLDRVIK